MNGFEIKPLYLENNDPLAFTPLKIRSLKSHQDVQPSFVHFSDSFVSCRLQDLAFKVNQMLVQSARVTADLKN